MQRFLYGSEIRGYALNCKTKPKVLEAVQRTAAFVTSGEMRGVLGKYPPPIIPRSVDASGGKADGTLTPVADGGKTDYYNS